uniref:Uncharacterized protein n=1 Tax=Arundo donax TaxID=35708 RepID=A0A0A9ASB2_ARUDO
MEYSWFSLALASLTVGPVNPCADKRGPPIIGSKKGKADSHGKRGRW